MKFMKIAWHDISSIFKNRFIRVSVVAIVVVPLLYSLLYLAAFWDPYSKLQKLPVAVVNLDKGGVNEGKNVNYGNDVIGKLKNNNKIGWRFVDKEDADHGVKNKKYYAEFVIPEEFSKKILDSKSSKPEAPAILYRANEKRNYLAAQINGKVELELKTEISRSITKEFGKAVFDKMDEVKSGMNKATDGSNTLSEKLLEARDGSTKIKDGLGQLKTSVPSMKDGVIKLYDGSLQLKNGLATASNGAGQIKNGVSMAKSKMDGALSKFDNNSPILKVLDDKKTLKNISNLMEETILLKDMDTSMLYTIPKIATSNNIGLVKKTVQDYKASGIDNMLKDPALKILPSFMTADNIQNVNKLIKDTDELSKVDLSKFTPLMGVLSNTDKISKVLNDAQSLNSVDTKAIEGFLTAQKLGSGEFVKATNTLSTESNKAALLQAVNTNTNLSAEQKLALSNIVGGYYKLTTDTAKNMQDSAKVMEGLSQNMSKLTALQQELKDNEGLIKSLQSSLSPENIQYVKTILPKVLAVKGDLDNNKKNLIAVKLLLAKVSDPSMQNTMAKVTELQKDVENLQPVIAAIEGSMTPENLKMLEQSPALVGKLINMQKELKDSSKLLEVAQGALSDKNIGMAKNLIKEIPSLKTGVNQLYDGTVKLADGTNKLYNGSLELNGGLGTLNSKLPTLEQGVNKLSDGSIALNDGMNKLSDGASELHSKLKEGSDKLNKNLVNTSEEMGTFMSEPIVMNENPVYPVKDYGTGFTPYFIPLSLWVGALMMFFVITDKVDEDIEASAASVVAGKFISYGYIGILQAIFASIVVLALGLKPQNVPLYFLFNILMSLTFIAIIQSLIFLLGQVGRMLSIVLLILQLTSCAGTFPLEVVPRFFKVLNPFMPFTYCVEALREVISGVDYVTFGKDVTVLIAVMVTFLIISMIMKGHADKVQAKIEERKEQLA